MPIAQPRSTLDRPQGLARLRAGRADTRNALSSMLRLARVPLRRRCTRTSLA